MPSIASLDGQQVFGLATRVREQPQASAAQIAAFFGVAGVQMLFGGSRGRTFFIEGVWVNTVDNLEPFKQFLFTYQDGNPHVLVDNCGNVWYNVVFLGEFQWTSDPRPTSPVPVLNQPQWCRAYRAVLNGLS